MSAGKAACMAGHAFLESFIIAHADHPPIAEAYLDDGGTKVVLQAADELELRNLERLAYAAGIPRALVTESKHVHLPDFDGSPVVVALGIGPVERQHAQPIVKGLKKYEDANLIVRNAERRRDHQTSSGNSEPRSILTPETVG